MNTKKKNGQDNEIDWIENQSCESRYPVNIFENPKPRSSTSAQTKRKTSNTDDFDSLMAECNTNPSTP